MNERENAYRMEMSPAMQEQAERYWKAVENARIEAQQRCAEDELDWINNTEWDGLIARWNRKHR